VAAFVCAFSVELCRGWRKSFPILLLEILFVQMLFTRKYEPNHTECQGCRAVEAVDKIGSRGKDSPADIQKYTNVLGSPTGMKQDQCEDRKEFMICANGREWAFTGCL
jgi:hypothetical protein